MVMEKVKRGKSMRVDGTGINDIFKTNARTEIKGQDAGKADHAPEAGAVS